MTQPYFNKVFVRYFPRVQKCECAVFHLGEEASLVWQEKRSTLCAAMGNEGERNAV